MIRLYCGAEGNAFALTGNRQLLSSPVIPLSCLRDQSHSQGLRIDLPDSCVTVAGKVLWSAMK
jgi:hypothetical protein